MPSRCSLASDSSVHARIQLFSWTTGCHPVRESGTWGQLNISDDGSMPAREKVRWNGMSRVTGSRLTRTYWLPGWALSVRSSAEVAVSFGINNFTRCACGILYRPEYNIVRYKVRVFFPVIVPVIFHSINDCSGEVKTPRRISSRCR